MSDVRAVAGDAARDLYAARSKRIADAMSLQQPDRIPVAASAGYLLATYGGISHRELTDDWEKCQALLEKFALEFQPDSVFGLFASPKTSVALGDRTTAYPGHGLGDDGSFQFIEHEMMKEDEYDRFLHDPSDFAVRTILPRVFAELEGLKMLPPLGMWNFGYFNLSALASYGAPPVRAAVEALGRAILASAEEGSQLMASIGRLAAIGFPVPPIFGAIIEAPFDFMSDTLRGMRGIMLDMLRQPDKLLLAEESVLSTQLESAVGFANATGMRSAMIPLHRGSDGFMSLEQFKRFYWPQLKQLIEGLADNDITVMVFFEGVWDKRLEYLRELPKGKVVGYFQKSNMQMVKDAIGDRMCILGGMPNSLLTGGSVAEVREHTHKMCEVVGKGGGYVMTTAVPELCGCKLELVRAWIEATHDFGTYSQTTPGSDS